MQTIDADAKLKKFTAHMTHNTNFNLCLIFPLITLTQTHNTPIPSHLPRVRTLPITSIYHHSLTSTVQHIAKRIPFHLQSSYSNIAQPQMANRYNPPQKRAENSTANYFTPLTLNNVNTNNGASAGRVTTSPLLAQITDPASGSNIHAPQTHPSSQPHPTSQVQTQASASRSSLSPMIMTSHLRGDSTPYTPFQAPSMTLAPTPTLDRHNATFPHQTSQSQTTGLTNTSASPPPWPTPSPRFQKPFSSQAVPRSANVPSSTQKPPKPSVKHLTCFFWSEFGHCQWSDAECLYAHQFTGKVASAPVQVEVGSKSSLHPPPFTSSVLVIYSKPFLSVLLLVRV